MAGIRLFGGWLMGDVILTVELDTYDYVELLTQANSRGITVSEFALEIITKSLAQKEVSDLERLSSLLALNWVNNYGLRTPDEIVDNDAQRKAIVDEAELLGIREVVYSRANTIFRGE